MIRSLGTAVVVAIGVLIISLTASWALTRDTGMLAPAVIDEASRAATAAPLPTDSLNAGSPAAAPADVRLETVRQEAQKAAFAWVAAAVGGALLAALLWLAVAETRGRSVAGVQGQRSALSAWLGLLALAAVVTAGAAYYALQLRGFGTAVSAGTLQSTIAVVMVAALATYYFGTALGVGRVMRPSVPLATSWRR